MIIYDALDFTVRLLPPRNNRVDRTWLPMFLRGMSGPWKASFDH